MNSPTFILTIDSLNGVDNQKLSEPVSKFISKYVLFDIYHRLFNVIPDIKRNIFIFKN